MFQILHFASNSGEYIVLTEESMTSNEANEEFGTPAFELESIVTVYDATPYGSLPFEEVLRKERV